MAVAVRQDGRVDDAPFSEAIAEGVRVGDPDALAAVYRALVDPLTAWLRSQVRDPHRAEDLAEETFLELVRSCRSLSGGPFAIRAWLYRAAQRNLIDSYRYRARRPEDLTDEAPEVAADAAGGPEERAVAGDEAARVRAALAQLSPDQAQVLALRFLANLSAPEVAEITGKTEGAVRALQHRGVATLARLIRAQAVPIDPPTTPDQM
jgi:RNA polymerase sigma-70 factor (ECF subfamily)